MYLSLRKTELSQSQNFVSDFYYESTFITCRHVFYHFILFTPFAAEKPASADQSWLIDLPPYQEIAMRKNHNACSILLWPNCEYYRARKQTLWFSLMMSISAFFRSLGANISIRHRQNQLENIVSPSIFGIVSTVQFTVLTETLSVYVSEEDCCTVGGSGCLYGNILRKEWLEWKSRRDYYVAAKFFLPTAVLGNFGWRRLSHSSGRIP